MTDVKIKTVYGWVQRPEWHAALDALHFTGDRAFARKPTRDTIRDAGGLVEEAFEIYKTARMDGHTRKKAVTEVVNEMELNRPTYQYLGETLRMGGGTDNPQRRGRTELPSQTPTGLNEVSKCPRYSGYPRVPSNRTRSGIIYGWRAENAKG